MDEPFANIQATASPFSFENLFDIDDLLRLPYQDDSNFSTENDFEMLASPFMSIDDFNDTPICVIPDYSKSEVLQIIRCCIHYLSDDEDTNYKNQERLSGAESEDVSDRSPMSILGKRKRDERNGAKKDDVQIFLLAVPLKYRDTLRIITPTEKCEIEAVSLGTFKKDLVHDIISKRSKLHSYFPSGIEIVVEETESE